MFCDLDPFGCALIVVHPVTVLAAWVFLYFTARPLRDLLFCGVIALGLPILGPIAMLLYYIVRRTKHVDS